MVAKACHENIACFGFRVNILSKLVSLGGVYPLSFMCVVQMRLMFPPRLIKDDENGKKR